MGPHFSLVALDNFFDEVTALQIVAKPTGGEDPPDSAHTSRALLAKSGYLCLRKWNRYRSVSARPNEAASAQTLRKGLVLQCGSDAVQEAEKLMGIKVDAK